MSHYEMKITLKNNNIEHKINLQNPGWLLKTIQDFIILTQSTPYDRAWKILRAYYQDTEDILRAIFTPGKYYIFKKNNEYKKIKAKDTTSWINNEWPKIENELENNGWKYDSTIYFIEINGEAIPYSFYKNYREKTLSIDIDIFYNNELVWNNKGKGKYDELYKFIASISGMAEKRARRISANNRYKNNLIGDIFNKYNNPSMDGMIIPVWKENFEKTDKGNYILKSMGKFKFSDTNKSGFYKVSEPENKKVGFLTFVSPFNEKVEIEKLDITNFNDFYEIMND